MVAEVIEIGILVTEGTLIAPHGVIGAQLEEEHLQDTGAGEAGRGAQACQEVQSVTAVAVTAEAQFAAALLLRFQDTALLHVVTSGGHLLEVGAKA